MTVARCDVCGWTGPAGHLHVCRSELMSDARAQLWARVPRQGGRTMSTLRALLWIGFYAWRRVAWQSLSGERENAIHAAAEAVADFDEHYLGGKR